MLIEEDASEIYSLTVHPEAWLTAGTIQIFDGWDAGGKLVWEGRPGQERHYNFIPPIHCEMGVFVLVSVAIGVQEIHCYSINWRVKKWDRKKPMEADVIEVSREKVSA